MKHFFSAILLAFSIQSFAYFPHLPGMTEARIIATSKKGYDTISSENYQIEGVLTGSHEVAKNLSLAGVFKLNTHEDESSELGGQLSYKINKFVTVSGIANVNSKQQMGATFIVNGHFSTGNVTWHPFIKVDDTALNEVGLLQAFLVDGVLFTAGISYKPPVTNKSEYHNISVMLGFGFGGHDKEDVAKKP